MVETTEWGTLERFIGWPVYAICMSCGQAICDEDEFEHGLWGRYPHCRKCDAELQTDYVLYMEVTEGEAGTWFL